MARPSREERILPELPNHVITRGNNRRRLFSYPNDYKTFIWLLASATNKFSCRLNAISLMANHVHSVIDPRSVENISKCMAKLNQRYAQIRNERRGASGKLFEERFWSEPINDPRHLMHATMYIDANPIRAGIVDDALDYPWSTYGLHAGQPQRSAIPQLIWTPSEWYRSLGRTPARAARAYRKRFDAYVAAGLDKDDDASDWRAFASRELPYSRRLRRPNGSYAREPICRFGLRSL